MFYLILPPAMMFFLVSAAFAFAYHVAPAFVWTVVIIAFGMSIMFMILPRRRPGAPTYYFNIGVLCLVACFTGIGSGSWNYSRHFDVFWTYDGQAEYDNVVPTEDATAHLDAGRIVFSKDAHLDKSKFLAYSSLKTDWKTYCVVPIVGNGTGSAMDFVTSVLKSGSLKSGSTRATTQIQYWAAGVDCCDNSFMCGDASDSEAHAGLVYLPDIRDSGELLGELKKAAREADSKYQLTSSEDALFVRWVADPQQAMNHYYYAGIGYLVGSAFLYTGSSVLLGFCLHFGQRRPNKKVG